MCVIRGEGSLGRACHPCDPPVSFVLGVFCVPRGASVFCAPFSFPFSSFSFWCAASSSKRAAGRIPLLSGVPGKSTAEVDREVASGADREVGDGTPPREEEEGGGG